MAGFLETSTGLFSPRSIGKGLGLGGSSAPNMSANELYAQFTRDQWANYVNTFIPIENQLIKYATDITLPGQKMAEASADVSAAYAQQAGATARRLQGLGVTLSPEEQAAQQKQFGLSKSLADVQAQNVAGDLTRQRQASILGNPAPQ